MWNPWSYRWIRWQKIQIGEEKDYKVELYASDDDEETDSDDDTLQVKKSISEKKKGPKTVAQDSKQASADGNDVIDLVDEKKLTPKKPNAPDNSGLDSKHGKSFLVSSEKKITQVMALRKDAQSDAKANEKTKDLPLASPSTDRVAKKRKIMKKTKVSNSSSTRKD